jgi:hypothetical protein
MGFALNRIAPRVIVNDVRRSEDEMAILPVPGDNSKLR